MCGGVCKEGPGNAVRAWAARGLISPITGRDNSYRSESAALLYMPVAGVFSWKGGSLGGRNEVAWITATRAAYRTLCCCILPCHPCCMIEGSNMKGHSAFYRAIKYK